MKILSKTSDGLKRCYNVLIEAGELDQERNKKLQEVAKSMKLDGFRPGKVPLHIAKRVYGDSVEAEAKKSATESAVKKVLADENLAISFNYTTDVVKEDENGIEFTLKFELIPSFEIKDWSDIKLTKYVTEVTDDEVNDSLNKIRERYRNWVLDEDAEKVAEGHKVSVDLTVLSKLKKLKNETASDLEVVIGDESLVDDFWKNLIGAKLGDSVEFDITYPENFQDKNLAGKTVHYSALIKKIFKDKGFELNDDFAKALGFENLEKAKEWTRNRSETNYGHTAHDIMKRQLLDEMSKQYDFNIPGNMLELEKNEVVKQIKSEAERLKKEFTPEIEKECEKIATERVRLGFVIAEIAKREKITVSRNEVASAVKNVAMMYPGHEKAIAEMYYKRPGAINAVVGPLLEDKVVNFILEKMTPTERKCSVKELIEIDEEPFEFFVDKETTKDKKETKADSDTEEKPAKKKATKTKTVDTAEKKSSEKNN